MWHHITACRRRMIQVLALPSATRPGIAAVRRAPQAGSRPRSVVVSSRCYTVGRGSAIFGLACRWQKRVPPGGSPGLPTSSDCLCGRSDYFLRSFERHKRNSDRQTAKSRRSRCPTPVTVGLTPDPLPSRSSWNKYTRKSSQAFSSVYS